MKTVDDLNPLCFLMGTYDQFETETKSSHHKNSSRLITKRTESMKMKGLGQPLLKKGTSLKAKKLTKINQVQIDGVKNVIRNTQKFNITNIGSKTARYAKTTANWFNTADGD